jgi:transposase InsO family protein
MTQKRIHFPMTTAQQRRLLFETWEATGDVELACRTAHMGRSTFYYWKPRFTAGGYAALESFASRAPRRTRRLDTTIEQQVIALRRAHPDWGKDRIADELAKAHGFVPLLSPNTVRRILRDAGVWEHGAAAAKKRGFTPVSRTAEQPGQTLNIDLCFVPAGHTTELKLPAVSGSSGRLVVERASEQTPDPSYPGQVFGELERPYAEVMHAFVAASQDGAAETAPAQAAPDAPAPPQRPPTARGLRQEQAELRVARRQVRERRKQEDAAWRAVRTEQRAQAAAGAGPLKCGAQAALAAHRRALRHQRNQQRAQREREDAEWRATRQALCHRLAGSAVITAWIAILVTTDNCTRQCLGLPLFVAGSKVTAEMVVTALRALLPSDLQFLITDRGVHFTAQVFQQLATEQQFIHVLIARHRPQSNGIAERFVRTLKEWLANKVWTSAQELTALLEQFRKEYNDRPHQGLGIPGLSPNEFAERIWLM